MWTPYTKTNTEAKDTGKPLCLTAADIDILFDHLCKNGELVTMDHWNEEILDIHPDH